MNIPKVQWRLTVLTYNVDYLHCLNVFCRMDQYVSLKHFLELLDWMAGQSDAFFFQLMTTCCDHAHPWCGGHWVVITWSVVMYCVSLYGLLHRCFWALICVGAGAMFCMQMTEVLTRYFSYPKKVRLILHCMLQNSCLLLCFTTFNYLSLFKRLFTITLHANVWSTHQIFLLTKR